MFRVKRLFQKHPIITRLALDVIFLTLYIFFGCIFYSTKNPLYLVIALFLGYAFYGIWYIF